MPSQHKHAPIPFRPSEGDRSWLLKHAKATGQPVNRILAQALAGYREREDMQVSTIGKTCDTADCGQPAVAWYDYGTGQQWACITHSPFKNMVNAPVTGGYLCPTCHQPRRAPA